MKAKIQYFGLFLLLSLCFGCNSFESRTFIIDNSGSMGCGENSGSENKVDNDRCKSNGEYKVDLARKQAIRQVGSLEGQEVSVAIIEMGGVTKSGDTDCKARVVQGLTDNFTLVQQTLQRKGNDSDVIVPNHSGVTGTGKAIREAWELVRGKSGRHKIVLITDGEPNCEKPKLCDVVRSIENEIKGTENEGKLFEEIQIYGLGVRPGSLEHESMLKGYGCLKPIIPIIGVNPVPKPENPEWPLPDPDWPLTIVVGIAIVFTLIIVAIPTSIFLLVLRENQDTIILLLDASSNMAAEEEIYDDTLKQVVKKRKLDIAKSLISAWVSCRYLE